MHEQSLMNDLMRRIDTIAREHGALRVTAVRVRLGALAHMSADHFRDHFERASLGGPSEGALLEITVSADLADPAAQDILLESVDVECADQT